MKFHKVNTPNNFHLHDDTEHILCPRSHLRAPSWLLAHSKVTTILPFTLRVTIHGNAGLQVFIRCFRKTIMKTVIQSQFVFGELDQCHNNLTA